MGNILESSYIFEDNNINEKHELKNDNLNENILRIKKYRGNLLYEFNNPMFI